ncbi:hypothetical protein NPA08_03960 [Mycoplasmopsis citelli]|uniref:Uncharacterized protein n=1 Tax=Mycoplasmopsis citelli TaxID=171281 RepID=A0A449B220_9BACT|nr:hypothetical protein [Mycoplasmopsis citelli]UUD36081.1 hypothetical protein NPA08_03960 [Mycoplasmopsis citelli]VEU74626.1 Uncharacterised protein [Mycoplasmopsis citelli]
MFCFLKKLCKKKKECSCGAKKEMSQMDHMDKTEETKEMDHMHEEENPSCGCDKK